MPSTTNLESNLKASFPASASGWIARPLARFYAGPLIRDVDYKV
jgi:hypothetical protein